MDDSIIGTKVEGYRVQEILGRGGMGVVYKAEDVALSRAVALKRIDPSLASDEAFLRRFRSEARALARLDSPHIVSVYALRQTEIGLLIVMQYVEGGTLKDLIHEGPMDWEEALPIVKQMLTALEHAHGAEIIHRDIKPRNILLNANGTVKVTDFGLAKVYRPDSDDTVTEGVHGTLNYMSPEQVQGGTNLDPRSDLYSLGMTVYEMAAGRLPFDEDDSEFAIMQTIVEEKLPRPNRFRPEVSEGFVSLIMKALEKEPDDRFQSARAMREAFEAFEAQQEEAADTKTAEVNPLTHWGTGRRSRARVAGIGLLVVLLIVAGYVLFDSVGGNREPDGEGGLETPPPRSTAAFSIDTDPPGASVYLSGRLIGVTPLEDTVEGDSAQLRIQKSGYVPLDTAFGVGSEKQVDLSVQLTEEASQTALSVSTVPTGASVHLNGERIGTTPLDYAVEGSAARVRVQKEGYVPVDTVAQLNDGQRAQMDLQLSEVETDATPPPRGSIDLRASPAGTITVDGQRYDESTAVQLPVGPHQVRFEHPEHGTIDTTITVKDEQTQVLTCYFEQTIQVRSPERQGSVYLSGKNLEASTPHDLSRGPGTYGVGLRIANQGPHTIPGGVYRKMVDGREVERVEFSGDAKEITIGPSFVPETHVVTFRVRSLLERVRGEIERLPQELKQAIEEQEWGGLPAPLAAYYPDKLETFYAKHEVRKANVVVEDERIDGETVVLPVTVYVEYQQKGRGGIKHVPLPANWIWKMGDGDVRLLRIQSR